MKSCTIEIHVQALSQFIGLDRAEFTDLTHFNAYRKQCIYRQRNQYISVFLNQKISNLDFSQTVHGKPYLSQIQKFAFNHSHSQKNYALSMSQQVQDLGVDIEDLDRNVRFKALAKHAFHPNEYQIWQTLDFDPIYWFKVWTTKEAILKASGLGIRMSLNELDTQAHPLQHGGMCQHPQLGIFAYRNYQLPQTMLSIAWRAEQSASGLVLPEIEVIQH